MLFGGMMIAKADIPALVGRFRSLGNFTHAARLMARYLTDRLRYSRGTRLTMGNALTARLFYSLRQRGIEILFNAPIASVDYNDGRIAGATISTVGGKISQGTEGRGVGDRRLWAQRALSPSLHDAAHTGALMASEFNHGDGIAIGKNSAPASRRRSIAAADCGRRLPSRRAQTAARASTRTFVDRAKPGLIAVNTRGERFVNEAVSYHDFVEGMFDANASAPSIPCYLICDAAFIKKYGLGLVYPGTGTCGTYCKPDISNVAICWTTSPPSSASTRRDCAGQSRAITPSHRPASIPTSAKARPS